MKLHNKFKITIILLAISLNINNISVFASDLYITKNVKDITIEELVTISKDEIDSVNDFSITGSLVNDTNSPYANPYLYQINDTNGNYIFNLKLPNFINNKVSFSNIIKMRSSYIDYNIDYKLIKDNPSYNKEVEQYLSPSDKIESDNNLIIDKSIEIVKGITNPYLKAKKIFDFTYIYMNYDLNKGNKSALSAINTKVGVCEDYARLMTALLRSQGIPSRTVSGYRIPNDEQSVNLTTNNYNHMWVEFYINEYGWIPADPTITFTGKKRQVNDNFASLKNYYIPLSIQESVSKKYKYITTKDKPNLKIDVKTNAIIKNVNNDTADALSPALNQIKKKIESYNFPQVYISFLPDLI
jgi:transglutaminase-like putative cysteine protease